MNLFEAVAPLPFSTGKFRGRTVRCFKKNDIFFFYGAPFSLFEISCMRGREIVQATHLLVSGFLTVFFFGLFFFRHIIRGTLDVIFTAPYWKMQDPTALLASFGAICLFFFVYRIAQTKDTHEPVKRLAFQDQVQMEIPDFVDLSRTPKRMKVNIADSANERLQRVLRRAYVSAVHAGDASLSLPRICIALLEDETIRSLCVRLGIGPQVLMHGVEVLIPASEQKKKLSVDIPVSQEVEQALFRAYVTAGNARADALSVTDVFLSVVEQSAGLQELMYEYEVDSDALTNVAAWLRLHEIMRDRRARLAHAGALRSKHGIDRAMTAIATPFLNSFSQDLTLAAKFGHIPPVVAREKELDEIFRVIESGQKHVLLVGDAGVGKMSLVEGIAQAMLEDATPDRLKDKRLIQLSTSALLAGTTTSGAQERLLRIAQEVRRAGNIVLFIKNVHDLVSAQSGGAAEEGLDVSETLAELMQEPRMLIIATTTPEGYTRHIANSELGNRFSRIDVVEMTAQQAIRVLESKAGHVEYDHQVFFSYDAVSTAVTLSLRFFHDARLPESAMSILSETGAYVARARGKHQLVTKEDVAEIISQKSGVPAKSITQDEGEKLLELEQTMHARVIGQHEAVTLVASALRRARADIRSINRPIANFLFLGPTGVGKTELAKTIAEVYFGGEDRMIRLDMSEYQDQMSVYRLIGQPGQQGTGLLTEPIRQKPFSLILLDELEKADPNVLNIFLQVFDDGRLTDSVGRHIDFTNTIIIATSNAGTAFVAAARKKGTDFEEIRQQLIREELHQYYRPEFLNRFDGVVLFHPLEKAEIREIGRLMLKRVGADLEKRGVFLEIEDAALDALVTIGFDPDFGARPMRRAIQDHVENALADLVLKGALQRRDVVSIGEGLSVRVVSRSS